jgi:hypothetical protein
VTRRECSQVNYARRRFASLLPLALAQIGSIFRIVCPNLHKYTGIQRRCSMNCAQYIIGCSYASSYSFNCTPAIRAHVKTLAYDGRSKQRRSQLAAAVTTPIHASRLSCPLPRRVVAGSCGSGWSVRAAPQHLQWQYCLSAGCLSNLDARSGNKVTLLARPQSVARLRSRPALRMTMTKMMIFVRFNMIDSDWRRRLANNGAG